MGTGSWAAPDFFMLLPFGTITLGNRVKNFNFGAGYGAVISSGITEGRALLSFAGMSKIGRKVSIIFDSFIVPPAAINSTAWALLIPGIRIQTDYKKAFQFGFAGLLLDGDLIPFPIPVVQWYRKL